MESPFDQTRVHGSRASGSGALSRLMRAGVITNRNLQSQWASTHYYAARALERFGVEVEHLATSRAKGRWLPEAALRRSPKWLRDFCRQEVGLSAELADRASRTAALSDNLAESGFDFLLALHTSAVAKGFRNARQPVVYVTDATADLLLNYYPNRTKLSVETVRAYHENEREMVEVADAICVPTEWVAESFVDRYHAARDKVHIVEWGANLEGFPEARRPRERRGDKIHALFVGLDWSRKGGDVAVDAIDEIRRRGHDVELTIVGAKPPRSHRRRYVKQLGQLSRAIPAEGAQLDQLLLQADVLLHPARAECYGHVLCEALAFGVPVVATDTGGIPQCVMEGQTGVLLPLGAPPQDFAEAVLGLCEDPKRWNAFRERAVADFRARLNWNRWADRVLDLVDELVRNREDDE